MGKFRFKFFCATLALVLTCTAVGCNKGSNTNYNYTTVEPDYSAFEQTSVMHIGGWVAPYPARNESEVDYCTQEVYNDVAASGINTIYGLYEPWGMIKNGKNANERALEYCENAGINFYIRDFDINASLVTQDEDLFHKAFDKYLKYDSFAGALVVDEPSSEAFEGITELKAGWDKFLPDKTFFVNLFPIIASVSQLGLQNGGTYKDDYVGRFLEDIKPTFLSFDNYPMKEDAWGEPSILPSFLLNLQICAEEAKEAGVPLWCFIQDYAYGLGMRECDENAIRYQILSSMAFGIKGYQYFCYWTPVGDAALSGKAMVDTNGNKTDTYYAVQKVNNEILAMDHVYLNYSWVDTMVVNGTNSTEENKCFRMLDHSLTAHERIKSVTATEDLLVGAFKDSFDNDAFMVVNFSDPAYEKTNTVSLKLNGASKAIVYKNGARSEVALQNGVLQMDVEAGNGAFVIPLM